MMLEVNDLTVEFDTYRGKAQVLKSVSLSVDEGEAVGLVGETGCGKSVTAMTVMGLLPCPPARVVQGNISLKGSHLLKSGVYVRNAGVRAGVSMIFQDPSSSLNPLFSVGEQLRDAILFQHFPVTKALLNVVLGSLGLRTPAVRAARDEAVDMLKAVRMPRPEQAVKSYPFQLSGGMRQRAVIAMALSRRPILLIADEPTTALDVTVEEQILALLEDLIYAEGISLLLISHNLAVVSSMCRRVYVMYAGVIVEEAETAELFEAPRHPYTRGLIRAVPLLSSRGQRLSSIPGVVPSLLDPLPGCVFHPRCDMADEVCAHITPEVNVVGPGHYVKCHLAH